ncbi:hypothetical protein J4526_00895 [Desulfurococcaceae archaeon MEX13E-LK6-19]|nr:hypothetical protein J4526_00895 [Desulfurococcaceae archaeon MEX13E-LK6-19]
MSSKNLFKKVLHEKQDDYDMFVLLNDKGFIVCAKKTPYAYYAKIIRTDEVMLWNCYSIEEDPRGTYVFSDNKDVFIEKIFSKIISLKQGNRVE